MSLLMSVPFEDLRPIIEAVILSVSVCLIVLGVE